MKCVVFLYSENTSCCTLLFYHSDPKLHQCMYKMGPTWGSNLSFDILFITQQTITKTLRITTTTDYSASRRWIPHWGSNWLLLIFGQYFQNSIAKHKKTEMIGITTTTNYSASTSWVQHGDPTASSKSFDTLFITQ